MQFADSFRWIQPALLICISMAMPANANPINCNDNTAHTDIGPPQRRNGVVSASFYPPPAMTDVDVLNLKKSKGRFASAPALDNGGWIDGVYACDVSVNGKTARTLVSFNGKSDGRTIYTVASLATNYEAGTTKSTKLIDRPFRGYGIGAITAAGYTGTTWNGQPFAFTLLGLAESSTTHVYDVLRLAGRVGIDANRTAELVCKTDRALF